MKKGSYKTTCGLRAIVAQVQPKGDLWLLRGAVEDQNGVLWLNAWRLSGSALNGNFNMDLEEPWKETS